MAGNDEEPDFRSFVFESAEDRTDDDQPTPPVEAAEATLGDADRRRLRDLGRMAKTLLDSPDDTKLARLRRIGRRTCSRDGLHPIVWCRYIATADYLAEGLQKALRRTHPNVRVVSITGPNGRRRTPRQDRRTRRGTLSSAGGHRLPQRRHQPAARLQRRASLRSSLEPQPPGAARGPRGPLRPDGQGRQGDPLLSAPTALWTAWCSMFS